MSLSLLQQRTTRYISIGACLGFFCPVGWFFLRFVFFRTAGMNPLDVITKGTYTAAEHLALTLYMALGTAVIFALFARYFSIASQTLNQRAENLDELNRSMAQQKAVFESRYKALDASLKHFHITNTHIQRSVDAHEVFRLAADCLHEVLGYDRVNILMLTENGSGLGFVASRGLDGNPSQETCLPLDERSGVLGMAMRENRIFLVENMQTAPGEYRLKPPCDEIMQLRSRNFIICPITQNGIPLGVFGVDNKVSHRELGETDVEAVRLFAEQVSTALNRIQLVQGVESLIAQLQHTFLEVSRYRGSFADMVKSLKAGSGATARSVAGIAVSAEAVRGVVEDTSSATSQISHAIDEVSQNFDKLQQFVEHSIATMTEIAATARQVEHNATIAHELSETVQSNAEAGVKAVDDTFQGLEGISRAVDESRTVIEELAVKGQEISGIIEVINEINQKTNLLSLNAAIIAAQAGEHGRSFAVVADQIRGLSRETEQSAGAIAVLVRKIQDYTELAVKNIGETRKMVDRDIALGQTTGHALQLILSSAEKSMVMSREIRKSTAEQVQGSQSVARSVEELGGMSSHLLHSSREQGHGIRQIVRSVTEIKRMSEGMVAATAQQNDAIQKIDRDVEMVNEMSQHIFNALTARQNESYRVIEQLETVKRGDGG